MSFSEKMNVRPVIKLPLTQLELAGEFIAAFSVIFMLITLLFSWSSIPEIVPKHFGITGEIDAWGIKSFFHFPVTIAVILYVFLSVIARFPHIYNYPVKITSQNAERQYRTARALITALKTEIMLLFSYLQWVMITQSKALFTAIFIFIILGTLGYFIRRAYKLK